MRDKYIYSDYNDNFPFGRSKLIHYKIKKELRKIYMKKFEFIYVNSYIFKYNLK